MENLWTASTFFVALTLCTFTKLDHNVGWDLQLCVLPLQRPQPGLMDAIFSLVVKPTDFATRVEQIE